MDNTNYESAEDLLSPINIGDISDTSIESSGEPESGDIFTEYDLGDPENGSEAETGAQPSSFLRVLLDVDSEDITGEDASNEFEGQELSTGMYIVDVHVFAQC